MCTKNVQGLKRTAGSCRTTPLARAANLAGSPPASRQVDATTTGNPKPMMQMRSQRCCQSSGPHLCNWAKVRKTINRALPVTNRLGPVWIVKLVVLMGGKSWAGIPPSIAMWRMNWSASNKPEAFQAGVLFHLGNFAGLPQSLEAFQNLARLLRANFWNLFGCCHCKSKMWNGFGALFKARGG